MIRVLLWDIDNTLLDFPAAERLALQAAFRDFALGPCPEDRVARYAALNAGYWRERGEITKAELLTQRFQMFFQQEGLPCPDPAAFNRTYQDYLGETVVFLDHSDQLLRDLHSQVKQYAVTNGSQRVQEKKLARSGLGAWLDGGFISETWGRKSPSWTFSSRCSRPLAPGRGRRSSSLGTPSPATWPGATGPASPAAGTTPRDSPSQGTWTSGMTFETSMRCGRLWKHPKKRARFNSEPGLLFSGRYRSFHTLRNRSCLHGCDTPLQSQNNLCCPNYNFFHVTWVNDLLKSPEKAASLSVIGVKSLYILRQILGGAFGSVSED